MFSRLLPEVSWMLTGAATATWGRPRRTGATWTEAAAPDMPMRLVTAPGWVIISMPMPVVRVRWPLSMPSMMAEMERIMTTSMATAKALMRERRGRWTRFPTTSLFISVNSVGDEGGKLVWSGSRMCGICRDRRRLEERSRVGHRSPEGDYLAGRVGMGEQGLTADLRGGGQRHDEVVGVLEAKAGHLVLAADLPVGERHDHVEGAEFVEVEIEEVRLLGRAGQVALMRRQASELPAVDQAVGVADVGLGE